MFKTLEGVWGKVDAIEAVRLATSRDPLATLGTYTVEKDSKKDTPRTAIDTVAAQCEHDAQTLGGEQRYELKAYVQIKKGVGRNQTVSEEIKILGRIKFGKPDEGGSVGATLKEVTGVMKAMGEHQQSAADAENQRMENLGKGFELMMTMMQHMTEATAQTQAVNANMVRMHELTLQDTKEQRQEKREAMQAQYEMEMDERKITKLVGFGRELLIPLVPGFLDLLGGLAFKMKVDAAQKARDAGINVETPKPPDPASRTPPPPPSDEDGTITVEQQSVIAQELLLILERLPKAGLDQLKESMGEDAWGLFKSTMEADTDDEALGRLRKLPDAVANLTEERKLAMFSALAMLPSMYQVRLNTLLERYQIRFR